YAGDITMVLPHGGQVLFGERHELKVLRRNTADTAWEGDVIVSHSDPNFRWTLRSPGPDGWYVGGLSTIRSQLHPGIVDPADARRLIPHLRWPPRSPGPEGWYGGGLSTIRSELHRVIVDPADAGRLIATGHVLALP